MTDDKNMMPKINKNIIIGISIAVVLIFLVIIGWALFQKEKIPPEGEVIEEETVEDMLRSMAPSNQEPMTEEEQEIIKEELRQMAPAESKPMTEEERRETEERLRQMMPQ